MLQLERVFCPRVDSRISIKEPSIIEIENSFSLSAIFNQLEKKCVSTFDVHSICNNHPDWFDVKVQIVGVFSCADTVDTDDNKKRMHAESYDILFPYVQSIIAELSTKAGIPPLILEKNPIDFEKVVLQNN